MKKVLFVLTITFVIIACTKEGEETSKQEQVSATELDALKKDVEELKTKVESLSASNQEEGVSSEEFEALKKENEELKAQMTKLTSEFFEVDGLKFDKNGTLISVQKLESTMVKNRSSNVQLTTTRKYDAEGRVIEIKREYTGSGVSHNYSFSPYYWQKEIYEYSGKTCKTTVQTNEWGMAAGVPYLEEITETTYW